MENPTTHTITRYIVHSESHLDDNASTWPVRSVPLAVRKLISVDKDLLDGLYMLQNDKCMQNGALFPMRRNKHANGDLSCFSAFLSAKTIINRSNTPYAQEMLKQMLISLKLPMYTYMPNNFIVSKLLALDAQIVQHNTDAALDVSFEPIHFLNRSFFFNAYNVLPSEPATNLRVVQIELVINFKSVCVALPPPTPVKCELCLTRVHMWYVFRLVCNRIERIKGDAAFSRLLWLASLCFNLNKNKQPFFYFPDALVKGLGNTDTHSASGGCDVPILTPSQQWLYYAVAERERRGMPDAFSVQLDPRTRYSMLQNRITAMRQSGSGGYVCDRNNINTLPAFVFKSITDPGTLGTLIVCKPTHLYFVEKQCILHGSVPILYHGAKRRFANHMLASKKIVIATYNVVQSDFKKGRQDITSTTWHRIVLLDSQYLGSRPKTSEAILNGLHGVNRWCVSDRPFMKTCSDIENQLLFIRPPHAQTKSDLEWLVLNGDPIVRMSMPLRSRNELNISPTVIGIWHSVCIFPKHIPFREKELKCFRVVRVPWAPSDTKKIKIISKLVDNSLQDCLARRPMGLVFSWTDQRANKSRTSLITEQAWGLMRHVEFLDTEELQEQIQTHENRLYETSPFPIKATCSAKHKDDDCPVCLGENVSNFVHAKCGHRVCHSCAVRLIKSSLTFKCPMCRTVSSARRDMWRETCTSVQLEKSTPCKVDQACDVVRGWLGSNTSELCVLIVVVTREAKVALSKHPELKPLCNRTVFVFQLFEMLEPWFVKRSFSHVLVAQIPTHPLSYNVLYSVAQNAQDAVLLWSNLDDVAEKNQNKQYQGYTTRDGKHPATQLSISLTFRQKYGNIYRQPLFYTKGCLEDVLNQLESVS